MGEVHLADDTQLGRRVALKVLPADRESDPAAQRRLLREARSAATLDHPHICAVYEVGEAEGRPYIVMQCGCSCSTAATYLRSKCSWARPAAGSTSTWADLLPLTGNNP
jgi:hypothetical protein